MALYKKTRPTTDWGTQKRWVEWNQVGKHTSGCHPEELYQPRKTGQHSNSGNSENPSKILHKKINHKTHNHQIIQGQNERKNVNGSQRERTGHPQREANQMHSGYLRELYKPEESGGNIQHA